MVITFNPHPQEVLHTQHNFFLINTFEQKVALFEQFGIDTVFVIPFSETFSQKAANEFFEEYVFSKINVKAIFLGPNHHFGKQRKGNADTLTSICKEKNIELFIIRELIVDGHKVRSTQIRKYLAQREWEEAEKLVGHKKYNLII
jgi:FAD synthase